MRGTVVLLFAVLLPAQTPAPASLHGAIREELTGATLSHCGIMVVVSDAAFLTGTAGDGSYRKDGLPAGLALVDAECPGRTPVYRTVRLVAGQDLAVDVRIPPNSIISGRVLDRHRSPDGGATVFLIQSEFRSGRQHYLSASSVAVQKDGGFRFDELEPGRAYYLLTSRDGELRTTSAMTIAPVIEFSLARTRDV